MSSKKQTSISKLHWLLQLRRGFTIRLKRLKPRVGLPILGVRTISSISVSILYFCFGSTHVFLLCH